MTEYLKQDTIKKRIEKGAAVMWEKEVYENQDFCSIRMDGMDLEKKRFRSCRFDGSELVDVTWDRCVLENCSFASCLLSGVTFRQCAATNCLFRFASFFAVDFCSCKMTGANLVDADVTGLTIDGGNWGLR